MQAWWAEETSFKNILNSSIYCIFCAYNVVLAMTDCDQLPFITNGFQCIGKWIIFRNFELHCFLCHIQCLNAMLDTEKLRKIQFAEPILTHAFCPRKPLHNSWWNGLIHIPKHKPDKCRISIYHAVHHHSFVPLHTHYAKTACTETLCTFSQLPSIIDTVDFPKLICECICILRCWWCVIIFGDYCLPVFPSQPKSSMSSQVSVRRIH